MLALHTSFKVERFPQETKITEGEAAICAELLLRFIQEKMAEDGVSDLESAILWYETGQPETFVLVQKLRAQERNRDKTFLQQAGISFSSSALQEKFEAFCQRFRQEEKAIDPFGLFENTLFQRAITEFAQTLLSEELHEFAKFIAAQRDILKFGSWKRIPAVVFEGGTDLLLTQWETAVCAKSLWNYLCDRVDERRGSAKVRDDKDEEQVVTFHRSLDAFFKEIQPDVFSLLKKFNISHID